MLTVGKRGLRTKGRGKPPPEMRHTLGLRPQSLSFRLCWYLKGLPATWRAYQGLLFPCKDLAQCHFPELPEAGVEERVP